MLTIREASDAFLEGRANAKEFFDNEFLPSWFKQIRDVSMLMFMATLNPMTEQMLRARSPEAFDIVAEATKERK